MAWLYVITIPALLEDICFYITSDDASSPTLPLLKNVMAKLVESKDSNAWQIRETLDTLDYGFVDGRSEHEDEEKRAFPILARDDNSVELTIRTRWWKARKLKIERIAPARVVAGILTEVRGTRV